MSYKCFTFKTTCLLGNIMQAHIALATLRGCELSSGWQFSFSLTLSLRQRMFKIVCRGKDNTFSQLNARNKHKKVQKNALRDEFHFFAMNDDPLLIG